MIQLTRINQLPLVVNSDLIEHIDATPDTILSMTNGQKLVVLETVDEVVRRVVAFRRSLLALPVLPENPKVDPKMTTPAPTASPVVNGMASAV